MTHIRLVIRKCAVSDGTEEVSAILQSLLDRLTDLEKYEKFLLSLSEKEQEKAKLTKVIWQYSFYLGTVMVLSVLDMFCIYFLELFIVRRQQSR